MDASNLESPDEKFSGLGIAFPTIESPDSTSHTTKAVKMAAPTIIRPQFGTSSQSQLSLRSAGGMQGLLLAENGGSMVQVDPMAGGSGFREGQIIAPGLITPVSQVNRLPVSRSRAGARLSRHSSILARHPSASELNVVLSNSSRQLLPTSESCISDSPTSLEQLRSRARLELDLTLENRIAVEGGHLRGCLEVKVRKLGKRDDSLYIGGAKLRVVSRLRGL